MVPSFSPNEKQTPDKGFRSRVVTGPCPALSPDSRCAYSHRLAQHRTFAQAITELAAFFFLVSSPLYNSYSFFRDAETSLPPKNLLISTLGWIGLPSTYRTVAFQLLFFLLWPTVWNTFTLWPGIYVCKLNNNYCPYYIFSIISPQCITEHSVKKKKA